MYVFIWKIERYRVCRLDHYVLPRERNEREWEHGAHTKQESERRCGESRPMPVSAAWLALCVISPSRSPRVRQTWSWKQKNNELCAPITFSPSRYLFIVSHRSHRLGFSIWNRELQLAIYSSLFFDRSDRFTISYTVIYLIFRASISFSVSLSN